MLVILGISLALLNLFLWFCVPTIRAFVDQTTGRWSDSCNPNIMTGVQELLVYFDRWLARVVFPITYTLGFAAIPFIQKIDCGRVDRQADVCLTIVVSLLLLALEAVWIFLIAVGVLLRGPNWNIFWPGEEWSTHKLVARNVVDLSQYFWLNWMDQRLPASWALRELPGVALIGGYFLAGTVAAYLMCRYESRAMPYWRWAALVAVLQLAAVVPLKMLWCWLFNGHYWVRLDSGWNI